MPTSVAYGGKTHDASASQIAKAKASGQDYYKGGVRYSSSGQAYSSSTKPKSEWKAKEIITAWRAQKNPTPESLKAISEDVIKVQESSVPKSSGVTYVPPETIKVAKETPSSKTIKTYGIVSEARPPSTYYGRLEVSAERYSQQAEREPEAFKRIGLKTASMGLSAGSVIVKGVTHPFETAKEVLWDFPKALISDPFGTGYGVGTSLRTEPEKVFGETIGYSILGAGVKKFSPVKPTYERVKVPVEPKKLTAQHILDTRMSSIKEIAKTGELTVYKGVGVEAGKYGRTVAGVSEGRLTTSPKVDLSRMDLSKGYIPESPTSSYVIKKSLPSIYPKEEVARFKETLGLSRMTEKTPSRFVQKKFIKETETLSPRGVSEVLKTTKREGGQVYGSFPARQQMPKSIWEKYRGEKIPADVDVMFDVSGAEGEVIAQGLVKRLKAKGEVVRIAKDSPMLIESKRGGTWRHAVDIHTKETTPLDLGTAVASEKAWGLRMGQKDIKIEGVRTMRLSEQGVRKTASITTMREKGFAPEAHRVKDVGDYFAVQETLAESKIIGKGRTLRKLERVKKLYPEEQVYSMNKPKIKIADYSVKAPKAKVPKPRAYSVFGGSPKRSPYNVPSISPSISPFVSPSISPSPIKSPSPRKSPSIFRSPSISPYSPGSPSPYSPGYPSISDLSPSPSPSPSPSGSDGSSGGSSGGGSSGGGGGGGGGGSSIKTYFKPIKMKSETRKRKTDYGLTGFNPKYFASVEATAFNIKGKPGKLAVPSGLGIRPIRW